jgi:hypothetical protein
MVEEYAEEETGLQANGKSLPLHLCNPGFYDYERGGDMFRNIG